MKTTEPDPGEELWEAPPSPRRRHSRVGMGFACEYHYKGEPEKGKLFDLSVSGAFIESDRVPPVGEEIRVGVRTTGSDEALTLTAVVRHQNPHQVGSTRLIGFGVEFLEVTPTVRSQIQTLLSRGA